ncbi:hypothetical protein Anas_09378 [Armadillidium nasatum]|uniref:Uncharacterized protein n=1 Tax=Armadillidium nasatum TaxID=96803 RepID=A0A5N5T2Q2_9CRUS|nr:hypothetical protein Anas_09378 [Armadillidium nasatum]
MLSHEESSFYKYS